MQSRAGPDPKDVESALAHDLNNYLQVVMGNLEVLRRRASFVPEVVNAALNATRNAASLADRLVSVARLRNLEPRPLDLNRSIGELGDMLSRTLGESIRLDLQLAAGLPRALIDPRCLQTALLEVATNARNAMPGSGQLTLRTARADRQIKIELTDTGRGMAPEELARAFQPRLAGENAKPMALGLHLVERCLHASGGRVEISSQLSRGTTVTLYLPTE